MTDMSARQSIRENGEFYCFLKRNLPPGHSIEAEPQTSYYSEWQYRYVVRRGTEVIATIAGDFRTTPAGALVEAATTMLDQLGARDAHW